MRPRLVSSAREATPGRLASPRRARLQEHLDHGGGQGLRVALATPRTQVNGILTASGLRDHRDPDRSLGQRWARVYAREDDAARGGSLVVDASATGLQGLQARSLIDQNPYAIIEGICIGLHATGLAGATITLAAEDDHGARRLVDACEEVVEHGWPAADAVEVRAARATPPALDCGIEPLAHVTWILAHGVRAFRMLGTAEVPGTALWTVVGDVTSPGVYEVPWGLSLATIVQAVAGGRDVKAVYAGRSRPVATPRTLEQSPGSGPGPVGSDARVLQVYDGSRSIVDALWSALGSEPDRRCRDCALAVVEVVHLLERIRRGAGELRDLEALLWREHTIVTDHTCPESGQPLAAVRSTVTTFMDEFVATIRSHEPTRGWLPTVGLPTTGPPPPIEPRWCDSPRLGASAALTEPRATHADRGSR